MRFSRAQRISRDADIRRVQKEGRPIRTRHFSFRACASPLPFPRAGIIVPRHGQDAVARNRLKRQLREIVRMDLLPAHTGIDVIVRATPLAYSLPFSGMRSEVGGAIERLLVANPE